MTHRLQRLLKSEFGLIALVVPLIVTGLLLSAVGGPIREAVITTLMNLVLVVALYVFVGNSGIVSFGHIAFMAIGAYTSALLTIPLVTKRLLLPDVPPPFDSAELGMLPATIVAGLVAAAMAFVVSVPLMRLAGIAASIATLALLVIAQDVLTNWSAISGGGGTLTGVPLDTTAATALWWAVVLIVVAWVVQRSSLGLRLRAARDDEPAARSVGLGVTWDRRAAFTISAFGLGVGGSLYAHYLGSFSPGAFYLQLTFLTIAMLVVGGRGSLAGAVFGTIGLSVIAEVLTRLEAGDLLIDSSLPAGLRDVVLAAILLGIILLRPDGLTQGREIRLPSRGARPGTAGTARAHPAPPGAKGEHG